MLPASRGWFLALRAAQQRAARFAAQVSLAFVGCSKSALVA